MATRYVFVTGGVVSGLGKGITAASLGRLLKQRGLRVDIMKLDPYLNVDPGTMNPFQHGEVFVTDDGGETDLDLGHYERFTDVSLSVESNATSGKIYHNVISRERSGDYLGGTVQVIPHITGEIMERIRCVSRRGADVVIVEVGGTVGDIESQPFLEALRQYAVEVGRENCAFVHVSLIVKIPGSDELKSKPTQHSVKELRSIGIQPDIIVCRSDDRAGRDVTDKIALFCNVEPSCVIQNLTAPTLYGVPLMLHEEGLDAAVCRRLGLALPEPDLDEWRAMVRRIMNPAGTVRIALVGKYVALHDAYLSVAESLYHGGIENDVQVKIDWVDSELLTDENVAERLKDADGVIVPGGFGDRGIEGMICAIRYARENGVPLFGICLGMQLAVIEFARHVAGMADAHSSEFSAVTTHPVIDLMPEQKHITEKGGTMRLGAYPCHMAAGTRVMAAYGEADIHERHRHRYEFNNDYRERMEAAGLTLSGRSPDGMLIETVELTERPFHIGVQYHPEFKSRPNRPHPLFKGFVSAALEKSRSKT